MSRALGLAVLLAGLPALAWESVCYQYTDNSKDVLQLGAGTPCTPSSGPNTARQRWVGNLDEHRLLFLAAANAAGIPSAALATQRLEVLTQNQGVAVGSMSAETLMPALPELAERVQSRSFTVAELAQLPDYSYALWDWAQGHETCPPDLGASDPAFCHDFASHMGAVNANHFPPMAQTFYASSHALAVERARACDSVRLSLGGNAPRFVSMLQACAVEALTLEAIAQHYLQDAWSSGHMWQRWGSPDLADFPGADATARRETAVLVALSAGLIHGSRGVLQKLPEWTSFDVNDAMCAPHEAVRFDSGGQSFGGVGDDYLWALPPFGGGETYQGQWSKLLACSVTGILEVYTAAGSPFGQANSSAATLSSADLVGEACFGQRATNAAMLQGMALDFKTAFGQATLTLDSRLVGELVPVVATESGEVAVSAKGQARFRLGLQRQVSLARLHAKKNPGGTQVSDGALGAFMGVEPNGAFAARARPAEYFDPPLPWPGNGNDVDAQRARSIALLFRTSHAADFCAREDSALLATLKARAALSADARTHEAYCVACSEVVANHLRVGTNVSWDVNREPLCKLVDSSAAVAYQPGTSADSIESLARAHCGC
jgi:hypothetical protein